MNGKAIGMMTVEFQNTYTGAKESREIAVEGTWPVDAAGIEDARWTPAIAGAGRGEFTELMETDQYRIDGANGLFNRTQPTVSRITVAYQIIDAPVLHGGSPVSLEKTVAKLAAIERGESGDE